MIVRYNFKGRQRRMRQPQEKERISKCFLDLPRGERRFSLSLAWS